MDRSVSCLPRKLFKAVGIAVAGGTAVLLLAAGWYAQVHFFAHQDHVEARLSALPPGEADPPPLVADVIRTIEGDRVAYLVARTFVTETHGDRMSNGERHALNALWTVLLPFTLDERELVALYGSVSYFGDGYGLTYGAKRYFQKTPAELTPDEMLGLLAIARAPSYNSPENNPAAYRKQLTRFQEIYRSRTAEPGAE